MVRKNENKTNYHYVVETFDKNNIFQDRSYHMTSHDLCDRYQCCAKSLFNHINKPNKRSKKLGHILITRINEPVRILLPNPNLS